MITPEKECEVWTECFRCVGPGGEFGWPEIVDDRWKIWAGFCFVIIAFCFDGMSIFLPIFEGGVSSAKFIPHIPLSFVVSD